MHLSYHGKRTIAITKTPGDSVGMNRRVSLKYSIDMFCRAEIRRVESVYLSHASCKYFINLFVGNINSLPLLMITKFNMNNDDIFICYFVFPVEFDQRSFYKSLHRHDLLEHLPHSSYKTTFHKSHIDQPNHGIHSFYGNYNRLPVHTH